MSSSGDARGHLRRLVEIGVVKSWTEEDVSYGKRFRVTGGDDRKHVWRPKHVAAFWAGVCAGRNLERDKR